MIADTPGPSDSCTSVFAVSKGKAVTGEEIPLQDAVRSESECCDLATEVKFTSNLSSRVTIGIFF